jgi:hypothetical protein
MKKDIVWKLDPFIRLSFKKEEEEILKLLTVNRRNRESTSDSNCV